MRQVCAAALISVLATSSATAACNKDLFAVEGWSVEESTREGFPPGKEVTASFRYVGSKPIRMVSAFISFDDVLGKHIGDLPIERDRRFQPGDNAVSELYHRDPTFARVPDMDPEDVIVSTCTRAVVYDDGTKEEF